jgi:hypothetical protein
MYGRVQCIKHNGRELGKTNKKEWRRDDKGEGKGMREKCMCLPGKKRKYKDLYGSSKGF